MKLFRDTIWVKDAGEKDVYAEFRGTFSIRSLGKIYLKIAGEGHFAVYVNDELAYFGAAADYPWYKLYHKADISKYCVAGNEKENELRILVWYQGIDSQTFIKADPGVFFEVTQNGEVLLQSDEKVVSRVCDNYRNGYCKSLTPQLGFSFYYDNTKETKRRYQPSVKKHTIENLEMRKTGKIHLRKRVSTTCILNEKGYLIDMGEEAVGFLELEFWSPSEQLLTISYGEHLVDGSVQRHIGVRDFSVEFHARKGSNVYMNPFLRLAGRYLQVECEAPLEISYIGLRPTDYKVAKVNRKFKEPLLQRIYDVSVNTLHKCMHEHYEDCPWREQAMYTLDSRNQMLCGYYAFKGTRFQRENLLFIAKGQRKDGLLSLCFPTGTDIPIPFFSLVYFMQVYEYVQHTGDGSILPKVKPVLNGILKAFEDKRDKTGLIPNFPYPCWNFYEWSEGSNNEPETRRTKEDKYELQYDLILNCMYVKALQIYEELFTDSNQDDSIYTQMKKAICDMFYDYSKDLYRLSTKGEQYSQLGNSFAILIGLGNKELAYRIINDKSLIEVTLSMNTFYYDALLSFGDTYHEFILEDIRDKYGYMLEQGATTFWETKKGWMDFDGAGSLCHGWSAIPAYYLPVLLKEGR